jgi:hypothetical protein
MLELSIVAIDEGLAVFIGLGDRMQGAAFPGHGRLVFPPLFLFRFKFLACAWPQWYQYQPMRDPIDHPATA